MSPVCDRISATSIDAIACPYLTASATTMQERFGALTVEPADPANRPLAGQMFRGPLERITAGRGTPDTSVRHIDGTIPP
jgi:hypothetical protein